MEADVSVVAMPIVLDERVADAWTLVLPSDQTSLAVTLGVWTDLSRRLPLYVLERQIETVAVDVSRSGWEADAIAGGARRGSDPVSAADPRHEVRARLEDAMREFTEAEWAPSGSGNLARLMAAASLSPQRLIDAMGISPQRALALRRGQAAVDDAEARVLAPLLGINEKAVLEANASPPAALVVQMSRPRRRAQIARLTRKRGISEHSAWLAATYEVNAQAARQTGQSQDPAWEERIDRYFQVILENGMPLVLRELITAQVAAMMRVLEQLSPGATARLGADPFATLSTFTDLEVRLVPESDTGARPGNAGCSVAGVYIAEAVPPILGVAVSASAGRRAFTVLHEFGHHLQQDQPTLTNLLLEQLDGGIALEDAACDAFAADILLPASLVDRMIGPRGPTAVHIVDLWQASVASRAAACVRAAQRLSSSGHVVLLDEKGEVSFATSVGLPPIARGSVQGDIGALHEALAGSGRAAGRTRLRYRDGIQGEELHAQVVPMGGYLLLVAVTDRAPWLDFTPPSPAAGPVAPAGSVNTPNAATSSPRSRPHAAHAGTRAAPSASDASALPGSASKPARAASSACPPRSPPRDPHPVPNAPEISSSGVRGEAN
ncbi:ImmA/IrrE family metallo-endopeptidase [[Actinomadura] parvosata]|uniref:ImmA/IrrE family metallo-endopeptidase n=1 Tax=[Actinomadura] parvosata TaxID=1955412 RepID=UPI00406CE3FF